MTNARFTYARALYYQERRFSVNLIIQTTREATIQRPESRHLTLHTKYQDMTSDFHLSRA
jgi:hypothetical protein